MTLLRPVQVSAYLVSCVGNTQLVNDVAHIKIAIHWSMKVFIRRTIIKIYTVIKC